MLLLAALAVSSACTGGSGKPQVLPSLTATPSATPAPVVVPSAAKAHTPAGAAEFVKFYYAQLNAAYQAGDPVALVGLADPACSTCNAFNQAVENLHLSGQHLDGSAVRVLSAEAPPEQNGMVAVSVQADAPPRSLIARDGSIVQRGKADPPYHLTVFVRHVVGGWVIRAVKRG